jgi:hypothetical protein
LELVWPSVKAYNATAEREGASYEESLEIRLNSKRIAGYFVQFPEQWGKRA